MSSESGSGPVRIGLVGCGGISRAHARGLRALGPEWAKVVLCCDLDPDRARLRAEELDAEAFTTDWDEVFDHPEIEAVDLCLPHHLHAEAAIAAAQAGKHILIEKPLARTLEEADRILNAVQRSGVLLMVAFVERFEADHQRAKELLDAGAIGRPMLVRVDHNQNLLLPPDSWIRSAELLGGGALASAGCHRLDLLRWWLGEVDSVFAWTLHEPSRMEGEIAAAATLRFRSGAIANFVINWMSYDPPWHKRFWIEGTKGSLHNYDGLRLRRSDRDETEQIEIVPHDPFAEEIRHFLDCVRTGRQPISDGIAGRKAIAIATAAYESARSGRAVRISEVE